LRRRWGERTGRIKEIQLRVTHILVWWAALHETWRLVLAARANAYVLNCSGFNTCHRFD
jgi:hypothetical protein